MSKNKTNIIKTAAKVTSFVTASAIVGVLLLGANPLDFLKKKATSVLPKTEKEEVVEYVSDEVGDDEEYRELQGIVTNPGQVGEVITEDEVLDLGAGSYSSTEFDNRVHALTEVINAIVVRDGRNGESPRLITEDEVRIALLIINGDLDRTGAKVVGSPVEYLYNHFFTFITDSEVYINKVNELAESVEYDTDDTAAVRSVPLDVSLYNLLVTDQNMACADLLKNLDEIHQVVLKSGKAEESLRVSYWFFSYIAEIVYGDGYMGYHLSDIQNNPVALSLINLYIHDLNPVVAQKYYRVPYHKGGQEYKVEIDDIVRVFSSGNIFSNWNDTLYSSNGLAR